MLTHLVNRKYRVSMDVQMLGGLNFEAHVAPLGVQEVRNALQGLARGGRAHARRGSVVFSDQGNMSEMGPSARLHESNYIIKMK